MKSLAFILVCLLFQHSYAQKITNKIAEVKTLKIYGSNAKVQVGK